jgi:23S rRNA pseudouridine1911/1915/1917 synthase
MAAARRTDVTVQQPAPRLDVFLKDAGLLPSRAVATRLVRDGRVLVNDRIARASRALVAGDRVSVEVPDPAPAIPRPQALPLDVVYEDGDLMVINKAPGMVVHPGAGRQEGTMVNALLALHPDWPSVGEPARPGIVHRLDKGTSGLLLVARTDEAHRRLSADLAARRIERTYLAIARGALRDEGLIDAPVGRDPRDRRRMAVVDGGRAARTRFRAVEALAGATLLEVRLESGRTHQVRVHLAAIGHPLVGDVTYGKPAPGLIERPALHSARLAFSHPRTGARLDLSVEPPPDFQAALERLRAR